MSQMFIVSWLERSGVDTVLGARAENFKWHFVAKETSEVTRCGCALPRREKRRYAEIHTDQMHDVKGFCFVCFHDLCIDTQDPTLWDLYNKVDALNSAFGAIHYAITNATSSPEEISSALALLEQLSHHSVIESLTGL